MLLPYNHLFLVFSNLWWHQQKSKIMQNKFLGSTDFLWACHWIILTGDGAKLARVWIKSFPLLLPLCSITKSRDWATCWADKSHGIYVHFLGGSLILSDIEGKPISLLIVLIFSVVKCDTLTLVSTSNNYNIELLDIQLLWNYITIKNFTYYLGFCFVFNFCIQFPCTKILKLQLYSYKPEVWKKTKQN